MRFFLIAFIAGLFFCNLNYAQQINFITGARFAGMGNASVGQYSEWSLFTNPAGTSKNQKSALLLSALRVGEFGFLNQYAAAAIFPYKTLNIGLLINRFGEEEYNEQSLSLVLAHRINAISLGYKCNLIQVRQESQESVIFFLMEFGGLIDLSEQIGWGVHVININQPTISEPGRVVAPTVFTTGFYYQPWDAFKFCFEFEKNMSYPLNIKSGFAYTFLKIFTGRAGFNSNPFRTFYGAGFSKSRISIDYAFSEEELLGFTNEFSLVIQLKSGDN